MSQQSAGAFHEQTLFLRDFPPTRRGMWTDDGKQEGKKVVHREGEGYRATHQDGQNLPLTESRDFKPSCLGSR